MPILSPNAFGARAKLVSILPPGTQGTPVQPGVSLHAALYPDQAAADGSPLPDKFVVVAHVPKPGSTIQDPQWERVVLTPEPEERVGYHGETRLDEFHADDVPVDAAVAGSIGVWFSVETLPTEDVQQGPNFLKIDEHPGDVVAWGQGYGQNTRAF